MHIFLIWSSMKWSLVVVELFEMFEMVHKW